MSAVHHGCGQGSHGARLSSLHVLVQNAAYESLPGRPHEDRPLQALELFQVSDDLQVVVEGLPEAYARINDGQILLDAPPTGAVESIPEKPDDLRKRPVIHGLDLHVFRRPLHVHQDDRDSRFRNDLSHFRIKPESADVIHDGGSRPERLAGHVRLQRIDADRNLDLSPQGFDHRNHPVQFLLGGNSPRIGAGRLSAHVNDVRTLSDHGEPLLDSSVPFKKTAPVRKGVRGHIQNADDVGSPVEIKTEVGPLNRERVAGGDVQGQATSFLFAS